MAFLLVTLLVVLYSFQSLFLKLFSAKYPAEKSALASTVFNISYGAFAGITTLCAMGFRFSASKVTLICGLVNAVTLLRDNVSMHSGQPQGLVRLPDDRDAVRRHCGADAAQRDFPGRPV